MSNKKFGVKEVLDATLYDMQTNRPVIRFNTLKTSGIEVTTESVSARGGKGNPKLITWEINKEGTVTFEDALISPKSLELISGIARKVGVQVLHMVQETEYDNAGAAPVNKGKLFPLTASAEGVITLAYAPKEAVADILVYPADDDYGTPIDMAEATLDGNTLTVPAAADKQVIVYYTYDSADTAETYIIDSEHFAGTYKLVGDTVIRNETGIDEAFQVVIPNLKMSSGLTLNFAAEGDPSVQTFNAEIMREANGTTMIQMIKY